MKITEEQVYELVWEHEIESIRGESRRWSRTVSTTVEHEGKYYRLVWEEGLTEMHENEYDAQDAYEVKKITRTVTKEITEWVEI